LSDVVEGFVRFYPTTIKLPLWVRPLTLRYSLASLRISDFSVRRISPEFSIKGLFRSPYRPDIRPTLNPAEILEDVRVIAPVDGVEVVEWMQIAAAENIVMQARIAEYNALGSQLVGQSSDAYIPGVIVEDIRFESTPGRNVSSRGFAIAFTPRGNFNVPSLGKAVGVFRDLISWGSISWVGSIQYIGNLLKWKSLAETPITQTVGFYMDQRGNTAPQFFVQRPTRPALTVTVRQVFSSSDRQTLTVNFRDPTNYANVLGSRKVDIAEGTCEVSYTVSAFPYVPPLVVEIQPQDNVQTKLERYVVT
jgi:hypothetical protein